MEARRLRRFSRGQNHTLLPLRSRHLYNSVSCWYCDLKISSLNEPLYRFGLRYARFLRVWFAVGIGFSISALLAVTMSAGTLCQYKGSDKLNDLLSNLLFGFSPTFSGLNISFIGVGYLLVSTVISVAVHEFGHAAAASSEGIQMEYIAVFLAVLFPGALVAFNQELLEAKSRSTALRIYCAGIWHNAVCCAACGVALLLLPFIFSPLYLYGESPMVLGVSSSSPLPGYLSPGDVIVSLDGIKIHNTQDWTELATLIEKRTMQSSTYLEDFKGFGTINGRRGYCGPSSLLEKSRRIMFNQSTCSDETLTFATFPCSSSIVNHDYEGGSEEDNQRVSKSMYCLNVTDVIKLKRCDGLANTVDNGSGCICSEDDLCLSPVQMPGLEWVEITYRRPYSQECLRVGKSPSAGFESCGGTFLYVGDVISMVRSVWLTSYQPRWTWPYGGYLPDMVEKILMCTYHVSLTLALLNSLPVYFLDGESILEVSFCYFTFWGPRTRRIFFQACLVGGTVMSCLVFLRIFLFKFL
ncbi:hypothetical protein Ancab_020027 [Ancistrocladus abbreviatus]